MVVVYVEGCLLCVLVGVGMVLMLDVFVGDGSYLGGVIVFGL